MELQDKLFQIGFEVGGNLLNKYWKPNLKIQNLIQTYIEKEFKDNFIIGIQIRTEFLVNKNNDLNKFFDCAKWIESTFSNITKRIRWFVTSDRDYVLDRFTKIYKDKISDGVSSSVSCPSPEAASASRCPRSSQSLAIPTLVATSRRRTPELVLRWLALSSCSARSCLSWRTPLARFERSH